MAENDDVTSSSCGQPNSSAKLPTKLTALKLYSDSRMEVLISLGKSDEEINKMCMSEYKMMPDEQKLKWIRLAVEKSPVYLVYFVTIVSLMLYYLLSTFTYSHTTAAKLKLSDNSCVWY